MFPLKKKKKQLTRNGLLADMDWRLQYPIAMTVCYPPSDTAGPGQNKTEELLVSSSQQLLQLSVPS